MGAYLEKLVNIREKSGARQTEGLDDETIAGFIETDPALREAIDRAISLLDAVPEEAKRLISRDEGSLGEHVQRDFLNFYGSDAVTPYVPLAGAGPWIVTAHGAVVHDSGGYGMLGLGHAPDAVLDVMAKPYVMANVMTPSVSQLRLAERLKKEIGHARGSFPFDSFICMNSGSEAVAVAARIADIGALSETQQGARHAGFAVKSLSLVGGFHGRTTRPAQVSHSTLPIYRKHLASFQGNDLLTTVELNDVEALERTFAEAEQNGVFFDAFFVEPVMGEGQPGRGMSREFYDAARDLTRETGTMLVVDSIQAALRATGCLSIVDYPGFEDCAPPDMETYSKALNAGQFPLSVLALTEEAAKVYARGVYGNTMTTNPRALEVGCAVLDSIDDEMRENIRRRGAEMVEKLEALGAEVPGSINGVEGTGLIVCAELDPERHTVTGPGGVEERLRKRGVSMIHGGENGLRFTPHFSINSAEIDFIVKTVGEVLREAA